MNQDTETCVELKVQEHVAEIVLNRPGSLNAISSEMARQLSTVAETVARDTTVRVAVISSSNERAFCVGADLKERNKFSDAELMEQRPLMRRAFRGLSGIPVATIAAVTGFALGGGFEIALSCDLIVADETAVLGLPEVSVGLVSGGGGTQLLLRRVGSAIAADLVLTGRKVEIDEAVRLGLVDRRVAAGTAASAALALAASDRRQLSGGHPGGQAGAARGAGRPLAEGLEFEEAAWEDAARSGDRREGIAAFVEKRSPNWP